MMTIIPNPAIMTSTITVCQHTAVQDEVFKMKVTKESSVSLRKEQGFLDDWSFVGACRCSNSDDSDDAILPRMQISDLTLWEQDSPLALGQYLQP